MRGAFIREGGGAFIKINSIGNKSGLIQPSSIIIISCISNVNVFQHYLLTTYYKAADKWYVLTYKPDKGQL